MTEVVEYSRGEAPSGINLTEAAKDYLITFLSKSAGNIGVRFSVKKSGCSGLSYVVDPVALFDENDLIFPLTNSYKIFIPKAKYPFLKGLAVDYKKSGLNSELVYDNPNQKGLCGCGKSFTI